MLYSHIKCRFLPAKQLIPEYTHTHSFTPSGTIAMNSHTHGLNGHKHTFTPEGKMSSHNHPFLPIGEIESSFSGKTHSFYSPRADGTFDIGIIGGENVDRIFSSSNPTIEEYACRDNDPSILLQWTDSGDVHCDFKGTKTYTDDSSPKFIGTTTTTDGNGKNTTSETSSGSFIGSGGITGSNGSGTEFSIMPPYVVKYCFERIA